MVVREPKHLEGKSSAPSQPGRRNVFSRHMAGFTITLSFAATASLPSTIALSGTTPCARGAMEPGFQRTRDPQRLRGRPSFTEPCETGCLPSPDPAAPSRSTAPRPCLTAGAPSSAQLACDVRQRCLRPAAFEAGRDLHRPPCRRLPPPTQLRRRIQQGLVRHPFAHQHFDGAQQPVPREERLVPRQRGIHRGRHLLPALHRAQTLHHRQEVVGLRESGVSAWRDACRWPSKR